MKVILLFLDGVGLGSADPGVNPFFSARLPTFQSLLGGLPSQGRNVANNNAGMIPLDACLGVDGLPQSGTGQTSLFTGINGARHIGKHFGPYPHSTLKPIISEKSIFKQLLDHGRTVCFANAFPNRFFDYIKSRKSRITVTTFSSLAAGVRLRDASDLESGKGISADITNAGWKNLGYPHIKAIPPEDAGHRLGRLPKEFDFVLFEYWKTDHAGHAQEMGPAIDVLETFDGMLKGLIEEVDLSETLVVLTSDHGNIEDLSTKSHTRNNVPLIAYGVHASEFLATVASRSESTSLIDVTPVLVELFR